MVGKSLLIPFALSVALHAAVIGFCPVHRNGDSGQKGTAREMHVVGVIHLSVASQVDTEAAEAAEDRVETTVPTTVDTAPTLPPLRSPMPTELPVDIPVPSGAEETRELTAAPPLPPVTPISEPRQEDPLPAPEMARPPPAADPPARRDHQSGDRQCSKGEKQSQRQCYLAAVLKKIHSAKRYPRQARWRGWEGEVEVSFTIRADGTVTDIRADRRSTHALLDQEAVDMIQRAAPFAPIPRELEMKTWRLTVPLSFRIRSPRS